jgi:hypothetical protein
VRLGCSPGRELINGIEEGRLSTAVAAEHIDKWRVKVCCCVAEPEAVDGPEI